MKVLQKNHKKGLKYRQIICTISAIKRKKERVPRDQIASSRLLGIQKQNGTQIVSHKGWIPLIVCQKNQFTCVRSITTHYHQNENLRKKVKIAPLSLSFDRKKRSMIDHYSSRNGTTLSKKCGVVSFLSAPP